MRCRINEAEVHFDEHGSGVPVVALHGAGVDHREIGAALEAIVPTAGYRRIYPDLPGMGHSTTDGLNCNDDVVTLLADFIDHMSDEPVRLLGHSYGAYVARGLAAPRPDHMVLGLALLCPVAEQSRTCLITSWFARTPMPTTNPTLRTAQGSMSTSSCPQRPPLAATATTSFRVQRSSTRPRSGAFFAGWTLDVGSSAFSAPTLIAAGRRDSVVGYDATELLELYPHVAVAVIEDAGHVLMHERPGLLAAFLGDWLDRARSDDK